MIAKCIIANKKIAKVSFMPAIINPKTQPEPLPASDPRSQEHHDYLAWCCRDQKLDTKLVREGDDIVVVP
jgi:hypothetical protein